MIELCVLPNQYIPGDITFTNGNLDTFTPSPWYCRNIRDPINFTNTGQVCMITVMWIIVSYIIFCNKKLTRKSD